MLGKNAEQCRGREEELEVSPPGESAREHPDSPHAVRLMLLVVLWAADGRGLAALVKATGGFWMILVDHENEL